MLLLLLAVCGISEKVDDMALQEYSLGVSCQRCFFQRGADLSW